MDLGSISYSAKGNNSISGLSECVEKLSAEAELQRAKKRKRFLGGILNAENVTTPVEVDEQDFEMALDLSAEIDANPEELEKSLLGLNEEEDNASHSGGASVGPDSDAPSQPIGIQSPSAIESSATSPSSSNTPSQQPVTPTSLSFRKKYLRKHRPTMNRFTTRRQNTPPASPTSPLSRSLDLPPSPSATTTTDLHSPTPPLAAIPSHVTATAKISSVASFSLNDNHLDDSSNRQPSTSSTSSTTATELPLLVTHRRHRSKRAASNWFWFKLTMAGLTCFVLFLAMAVYFSTFSWGIFIGSSTTAAFLLAYFWLTNSSGSSSDGPLCPLSGLSMRDRLCCSLHAAVADLSPTDRRHSESLSATSGPGRPFWPIYAPAIADPNSRPLPQLRHLAPLTVPHTFEDEPGGQGQSAAGPLSNGLGFKLDIDDQPIYRSWMNEVTNYNAETHHVSISHSIFVTLDGCQLRLQRPKQNIPRRSVFNEESPSASRLRFTHQRIIDLVGSRITLLPHGLVAKRLWSKKYPIAIMTPINGDRPGQHDHQPPSSPIDHQRSTTRRPAVVNQLDTTTNRPTDSQSTASLHASASEPSLPILNGDLDRPDESAHSSNAVADHRDLRDDSFEIVSNEEANFDTVYLFGRTCREKEAWFRRLTAASEGKPFCWTPQSAIRSSLARNPPTVSSLSRVASTTSDHQLSHDEVTGLSSLTSPTLTTASASVVPDSAKLPSNDSMRLMSDAPPHLTSSDTISTPLPCSFSYLDYIQHMAKFMPAKWLLIATQALSLNTNHINCDPNVVWLNALLGRVFWDFLRAPYWTSRVRDKIQAKLKKLHLPPFISDLIVVDINIGSELPIVRHFGRPFLDPQGLWLDFGISYAGGFSLTLETNVTLSKWNQKSRMAASLNDDLGLPTKSTSTTNLDTLPETNASTPVAAKLGAYISDEEDSVDSSTDSDTPVDGGVGETSQHDLDPPSTSSADTTNSMTSSGTSSGYSLPIPPATGQSSIIKDINPLALPSKRRLVRFVDKIARSSYFQKAVDNKFVQRGMEMLSNKPIVLEVEVQVLSGTLLVNIPPPPSDRLWYGFRPTPQLRLKAKPKFGERVISLSKILEWIEKKFVLEFQRVLVLPNMDDLIIPLLLSDVTST